jgi:hypothetical protein
MAVQHHGTAIQDFLQVIPREGKQSKLSREKSEVADVEPRSLRAACLSINHHGEYCPANKRKVDVDVQSF